MKKTFKKITSTISLCILLTITMFVTTACGTKSPYEGIWASNISPDFIIIDGKSNITYIKGTYEFTDEKCNVVNGTHISTVYYGTIEDGTLLFDKAFNGNGETYYNIEDIPKEDIIDLPSRDSIVVNFDSDVVFSYKKGMYSYKFTKQASDYKITYGKYDEQTDEQTN